MSLLTRLKAVQCLMNTTEHSEGVCLQATIAEQQPQFGQVMQQLLER